MDDPHDGRHHQGMDHDVAERDRKTHEKLEKHHPLAPVCSENLGAMDCTTDLLQSPTQIETGASCFETKEDRARSCISADDVRHDILHWQPSGHVNFTCARWRFDAAVQDQRADVSWRTCWGEADDLCRSIYRG